MSKKLLVIPKECWDRIQLEGVTSVDGMNAMEYLETVSTEISLDESIEQRAKDYADECYHNNPIYGFDEQANWQNRHDNYISGATTQQSISESEKQREMEGLLEFVNENNLTKGKFGWRNTKNSVAKLFTTSELINLYTTQK
jgi:hypothetical protein